MPRVSEDEKRKSHDRILEAAARLFRENGMQSTSVSDVMQAAGLTHGGFYRHFPSKEALVLAAFRHAVDKATSDMQSATTAEERDAALKAYIDQYLSKAHVADTGHGCPMAAMGAELPRSDGDALDVGAESVALVSGLLRPGDDGDISEGMARLALLIGTITLARLTQRDDGGAAALEAGRAALTRLMQGDAATDAR